MIAVRLFAKQTVTKKLKSKGCNRLESPIADHSYWRTPFGFHFFVPELGPDKRCPEHVLNSILADIERRKPTNH